LKKKNESTPCYHCLCIIIIDGTSVYMGEAEFPVLDEETRKSLKALGYID
jgi:hypothetical protein